MNSRCFGFNFLISVSSMIPAQVFEEIKVAPADKPKSCRKFLRVDCYSNIKVSLNTKHFISLFLMIHHSLLFFYFTFFIHSIMLHQNLLHHFFHLIICHHHVYHFPAHHGILNRSINHIAHHFFAGC